MIATGHGINNTLVVAIDGSALDAESSKSFRNQMKEKLQGQMQVVLDLSGVTFVDSSGLGALIACLRQVTGAGGDLKLSGLQPQVRALFELVRMHHLFSIYNTQEEAARSFR